MPINILMPALSPTMEEGALSRWLVKEGDAVAAGDVIAEIETDKATMEVEAIDQGTIGRLVVAEGAQGVKVNEIIAVLLEDGEEAGAAGPGDGAAAPSSAPTTNVSASGAAAAEAARGAASAAEVAPAPAAPRANGTRLFASPLARRIALERGVDLAAVSGSGPHGRIVKADVERAGAAAPVAPAAAASDHAPAETVAAAPPPPQTATQPSAEQIKTLYAGRDFEEVRLDGMRRTIAQRLGEAKRTIPHFYLRREIALDALLAFRADLNAKLEHRGVKLSVNDFIIKASAIALQEVPGCNAAWAGDRVLQFRASDVAVAVAVEGGLFTPVILDAETKTLSAISTEMKDLASRARDRKLQPAEYEGGAFAISNLGMFGVENFDAVINPPQASILAVGAGVKKPVIRDEAVAVATMMSVTLSVDHRVIDGALGARFLDALKRLLEEPVAMLA